jgi:hypothetical protein
MHEAEAFSAIIAQAKAALPQAAKAFGLRDKEGRRELIPAPFCLRLMSALGGK